MKSIKFILAGLIILLAIIAFSKYDFINIDKNSLKETGAINKSDDLLKELVNSDGPVSIIVKPKNLSKNTKTFDFEISLNTHSVELNYDLIKTSELIDDRGNVYKPIVWEGDPPKGHHRTGILRFNKIIPLPQSVTLIIRQVGDITERKFKWTLLEN